MNFDKDYTNFLDHISDLDKCGTAGPVQVSYEEDVFVGMFIAYLNIRYAETHLTSTIHSDGKGRCPYMVGSQLCGKYDGEKCIA